MAAQARCGSLTLPAYAHNDYENPRPLADAVSLGFRGVEVDVFLIDGTLRLGHSRRDARAGATLESQYLDPLRKLVPDCGKLTADRSFLLFIDLKEDSPATFDTLTAVLERYPALFVAANSSAPPIEVVLVGWRPTDVARGGVMPRGGIALQYQHRLTRPDPVNRGSLGPRVRLISVDYGKTIGRWWVTPAYRRRWFAAINASKLASPDQLLRVHNVSPDKHTYSKLLAAGVDLIGTKEPERSQRILETVRERQ